MDWAAIVFGTAGLFFGTYGAWRSWRTDRALKLLGKKWDVEPNGPNEYLVYNRQPRTVYGVAISPPAGNISEMLWGETELAPNEAVGLFVGLTYGGERGPMVITWHHRADLSDVSRTARIPLPYAAG